MTHNKQYCVLILFIVFALSISCNNKNDNNEKHLSFETNSISELVGEKNFISDYPPITTKGKVNVVIEIPAGTTAKWELIKTEGTINWEWTDGKFREVQYLGYPGNYGFIPQTLLPKDSGGDGDPLDVIILGPSEARGTVIDCNIIGILKMLDNGEKDDKLIAVCGNSPFYMIKNISELNIKYPGVTTIISTWFTNYKGSNQIELLGYGSEFEARLILNEAINEFNNNQ